MSAAYSEQASYERGLALAEDGRHAEALACVREHLLSEPTDGEALNDAGVILYLLGRYDEAASHLEAAAKHLDEARPQALWNLMEVHLAAGRPDRAVRLFDQMSQAGLLTADLANRTAEAFLVAAKLRRRADQSQEAAELLQQAREILQWKGAQ